MSQKPSISIVGPGNVANALGTWLHAAGYHLDEVVARRRALPRARALARRVRAKAIALDDAGFAADIIWLTVPDDAIAACARELADRAEWKGKIAVHSSGALTSNELAPLRRRGAAVASVHPMMTFVRGGRTPESEGIPFAIEGDTRAVRAARRIVRDLGGGMVTIKAVRKPLYHALGAFASPLIVAELALAERIARAAGIPAVAARRTIAPILRKTLENYIEGGAAAAFSGPLVRGDAGTIRKHLDVLRAVPGARESYLVLARAALANLPVGNRRVLKRLLRRD